MRQNLMTVPSCDTHNSEKSRDDVYFLNVITGLNCINETGREHYRRQIRRQHQRNPSILSRFAERELSVESSFAHRVEIERLDNFARHLGYAIFLAHFGKRWAGNIGWFPEFLSRATTLDSKAEQIRLIAIEECDQKFRNLQHYGSNQAVFSYQVLACDMQYKMRLHFYEGCKALLIFSIAETI